MVNSITQKHWWENYPIKTMEENALVLQALPNQYHVLCVNIQLKGQSKNFVVVWKVLGQSNRDGKDLPEIHFCQEVQIMNKVWACNDTDSHSSFKDILHSGRSCGSNTPSKSLFSGCIQKPQAVDIPFTTVWVWLSGAKIKRLTQIPCVRTPRKSLCAHTHTNPSVLIFHKSQCVHTQQIPHVFIPHKSLCTHTQKSHTYLNPTKSHSYN